MKVLQTSALALPAPSGEQSEDRGLDAQRSMNNSGGGDDPIYSPAVTSSLKGSRPREAAHAQEYW